MKAMTREECEAVLSKTGVTFEQLQNIAAAYLMTAILRTDAMRNENPNFIRTKEWDGEKRNTPSTTAELGAHACSVDTMAFAAGIVRLAITKNGPYDGPYARKDNEIVGRVLYTLEGGARGWVRLIEQMPGDAPAEAVLAEIAKDAHLEM